MMAIEVESLFFSYDFASILEDISFKVEAGEFVGIFGPNGGGKTTLLSLLMGFLKPSKGKISILGTSPKAARPQIGWVPQSFFFDRSFPISVREVVLGGRLFNSSWHGLFKKKDHEAAEEALALVAMEKWIEAPFASLSGGQAQRVLIARALASKPSLLFLDEPTASIDVATENAIYELLGNLKKSMTIVMVTHDLEPALKKMDRLFCVQKTITPMEPNAVCDHFALGLYHPAVKKAEKSK